jgi:predicted transcriptional regulator YdeE
MLRLPAILLAVVLLGNAPMSLPNEYQAIATPAVEMPAFTVVGPFVRTTNAVEMSGKDGRIGPLWHHFLNGSANAIPGVVDPKTIYAVYTGYESDETGAYDLILGKSVRAAQQAPPEMKSVAIPASRYRIFAATDRSPDAIMAAWRDVYRYFADHPAERRAFTYDFEQHSEAGTRIFIAIR